MIVDAIGSTYANGLAGVRRALDGLRREARTVAHGVVDGATADLTSAMVRSLAQQRTAEANAAALRRADRARGSAIDILV